MDSCSDGVMYVAELMTADGFDLGHATIGRHWVTPGANPHHTRELNRHVVLLKTIGRSLITFQTARDLVTCIADAMEGHTQALERCTILHRDISMSNIMITLDRADRRGFLVDWDHCDASTTDIVNSQAHITQRVSRTGTWRFLSARLADAPDEEQTAVDDREAALHVLMWCALRYLCHNLTPQMLLWKLAVLDACVKLENYSDFGGGAKRSLVRAGLDAKFEHDALAKLIDQLCATFAARYISKPDIPQDATAREMRRVQYATEDWEEKLANLDKSDWLYKTMRRFAERLPDEKLMDWKDNGTLGKRTLGATDSLNNAKSHDRLGPSTSEVVPESSSKRQRR